MASSSTHFDTLQGPRQQVLAALAAGSSIAAAARDAGIHRSSIHNWLKEEAFRKAFDTSRQEYVESLRDQLRELSALALDTLRSLLNNPATSPSVRLKAALAVLERPVYPKPGWQLPEKVGTPAHEQHIEEMAELEAEYRMSCKEDEIVKTDMRQGHTRIEAYARNAPCPCGSGKKYKRCCGVNAPPLLNCAA